MAYKIEDDVPMPTRVGEGTGLSATLRKMGVGQSVFVEGKTAASLSAIVTHVGRPAGIKFTVRKVGGGYRIWRIS